MITLNCFLRKLPELVVDNLRLERSLESAEYSSYHIKTGVWKLRKIGYNDYEVEKLMKKGFVLTTGWSSSATAGDIQISGISMTLTGVVLTLGEDAPYAGLEDV